MVVQRLVDLAENGLIRKGVYEALAAGGQSATAQVITRFLTQSITHLPKFGFSAEDGRKVLVALAHSSGKKGSANESRIAAEARVSPETLAGLLARMAQMRLVRRMESGNWEIMHDLMAKSAIEGLISEEERYFKQVREILDARARTFDQYHGTLALHEVKDLWAKREQLPSEHLSRQERTVMLLTMGTMEPADIANAGYDYGQDIEDVRGELTDPARWSAPGWYWLSALSLEDLLGMAQALGKVGKVEGAVGYLRIAQLVGSSADVPGLANLLLGPFSGLPKFAEDGIACIASLATEANLPLLRGMAKHKLPIVRRAAAKAIGMIGTRDDLVLLNAMASDEYPHPGAGGDVNVREAVAEAVGKLGYREGLPVLRAMMHDKDSNVLAAVAMAITRIGDPDGLPLLQELSGVTCRQAQHAAAKARVELNDNRDLAPLPGSVENGNALIDAGVASIFKDRGEPRDVRERNLRHAAIFAITELGNDKGLSQLRALAVNANLNWPIRRNAVRALGALGERADLSLLLDIAAKDDGVKHLVGRTAARVCWQLATRDDLQLLESTIQNPGTLEVLQGAISAMARQFADTEVLAAMSGVLLDPRPVAARMAAEAAVPRTSDQQLRVPGPQPAETVTTSSGCIRLASVRAAFSKRSIRAVAKDAQRGAAELLVKPKW